MRFLRNVGLAFNRAKGSFLDIQPGIPSAFNGKTRKAVSICLSALFYKRCFNNLKTNNASDVLGAAIAAGTITKLYKTPMRNIVSKGYALNTIKTKRIKRTSLNEAHLIAKKKTWFNSTGKMTVRIIYHEGNKRGAHIDMHFSNGTSFVVDVRNKPIANDIKLNTNGELTQKSIKILMNHLKDEFDGGGYGSRVFQNYDHNPEEAKMEWFNNEIEEGYGSGRIRQVIHESDVHILWHNNDNAGQATSIYMPGISSERFVYFHQLHKNIDVAKMGFKAFKDVKFEDRLHLKMVEEETFKATVDSSKTTYKYDGASSYIETDKHGTRFFSPRDSVKTGHRIDYTGKMPTDVINTKSEDRIKGMGELLFKRNGKYLSSTDIGGLLNGNSIIPEDIETEYRLYRVDSIGRTDVRGLSFDDNRALASSLSETFKSTVKIPEFISVEKADKTGIEGVVGILPGGNVFNGLKLKFRDNFDDWKISDISLVAGKAKAIKGVVECIDSNNKIFNLGAGQLTTSELARDMMSKPKDYIGRTIRVAGFRGHSGRAAQMIDFHLDK